MPQQDISVLSTTIHPEAVALSDGAVDPLLTTTNPMHCFAIANQSCDAANALTIDIEWRHASANLEAQKYILTKAFDAVRICEL
jgi:hypothetical protein